jgi:hypothetical protein
MGQFLYTESILWTGTSAINTTNYTAHPYNGVLRQITISTGGVGSSGTTAWMASSTATTNSTGQSSTAIITFKSEKTGAIFIKGSPGATPGVTYYPVTGGHSSSGGIVNAMSTTPFYGYPFPLCDDRLCITSTDISAFSNGFCHTIYLLFEGSRY